MPNYDYNPITDMVPAFAGMLADTGFTDKVTHPAGGNIRFGAAVAISGANDVATQSGVNAVGIALQDHTVQAGWSPTAPGGIQDGYAQFDAVSVIKRGRVWMLASGACTKGTAVKLDANGLAQSAGENTLVNAVFLSGDMQFDSRVPGMGVQRLVLVELHAPTIA